MFVWIPKKDYKIQVQGGGLKKKMNYKLTIILLYVHFTHLYNIILLQVDHTLF